MSLIAGSVSMPDMACIGAVTKVGDAYLSKKGVYTVMPITVAGKFGAPKESVFFLLFEPRWFGAGFDASTLLKEGSVGQKKFGMFRRHVYNPSERRPAVLASILGDKLTELDEETADFDEVPEAKAVSDVLRKHLVGQDALYVLTQREDEGEITEQYNIANFFPYTEESMKYLIEQSEDENRKTPLVIAWDVE